MDWSSPYEIARGYETLVSSTRIHHDDLAHMITMEMFTRTSTSWFRLDTWEEDDEEHISLPRQGNVRIEARFNKPLPETVKCILYAEFRET